MDTTTRPVTAATRRARNLRCSSSVPGRLTAVYGQTAVLGLQAGARAFVRQRLLTEDSEPVELASAWLPLELVEGLAQVRGVDDEDPVEEFAAYATYPAFHDRVHAWRLWGGEHDPDALGAEHFVEHRGELGVAVTDQEFEVACLVAQVEHQVAGLLGDPCGGRVRGDTQDLDAAGGVL